MRTLKKLEPNVRFFLERQLVGASNALFRFEAGRESSDSACNTNPCETGFLECTPVTSGTNTILYHFNANDAGGSALPWTGLLGNQGGSPGQGAEGSSFYYFKASSPRTYSDAMAIDPDITIRVTGYCDDVDIGSGDQFVIVFFDSGQVIGTPGNAGNIIETHVLEDNSSSGWAAFDPLEVVVPSNATSFGLGRLGASISFDEVRITQIGSPIAGECTIVYQNGDFNTLESDAISEGVFSLLVASSSSVFELPTLASEVSMVYLDYVPTDLWDFDPDANTITFPTALADNTYVHGKYIYIT